MNSFGTFYEPIKDDPMIVAEIRQACATIRKAMVQINELSGAGSAQAFNQMTRWVNTKEEHACKIITLVSEYCLCQRVKPIGDPKCPFASEADYIGALQAHHAVMLGATKCKQTVDPANAATLDAAVDHMAKMYSPK